MPATPSFLGYTAGIFILKNYLANEKSAIKIHLIILA